MTQTMAPLRAESVSKQENETNASSRGARNRDKRKEGRKERKGREEEEKERKKEKDSIFCWVQCLLPCVDFLLCFVTHSCYSLFSLFSSQRALISHWLSHLASPWRVSWFLLHVHLLYVLTSLNTISSEEEKEKNETQLNRRLSCPSFADLFSSTQEFRCAITNSQKGIALGYLSSVPSSIHLLLALRNKRHRRQADQGRLCTSSKARKSMWLRNQAGIELDPIPVVLVVLVLLSDEQRRVKNAAFVFVAIQSMTNVSYQKPGQESSPRKRDKWEEGENEAFACQCMSMNVKIRRWSSAYHRSQILDEQNQRIIWKPQSLQRE